MEGGERVGCVEEVGRGCGGWGEGGVCGGGRERVWRVGRGWGVHFGWVISTFRFHNIPTSVDFQEKMQRDCYVP